MTTLDSSRRTTRDTALIGLLGATTLGALGHFRSAFALILGSSVAIVSALWLAALVERLAAPRRGPARFDGKFALKGALRYAVVGLILFGAVRLLPSEVPWLLAGVSTVVAALVAEGIGEAWRSRSL